MKNKQITLVAVLSVLLAFYALLIPIEQKAAAVFVFPYDSGYIHGCNDAKIGGHPYLNSPGHGPTFHSASFIQGYSDGYNVCLKPPGDYKKGFAMGCTAGPDQENYVGTGGKAGHSKVFTQGYNNAFNDGGTSIGLSCVIF
ncbi:MAG TPA: hypothetical protein VFD60_10890 [Nitrososphaeraceae archaeon]|jgi:hypothetical protein|nr:hypothetical protein [Nitrososphaeraceae archaeon]